MSSRPVASPLTEELADRRHRQEQAEVALGKPAKLAVLAERPRSAVHGVDDGRRANLGPLAERPARGVKQQRLAEPRPLARRIDRETIDAGGRDRVARDVGGDVGALTVE